MPRKISTLKKSPVIVVTGSIGKSDVIHLLSASIKAGALPCKTRLLERAKASKAEKGDVILDMDKNFDALSAGIEHITHHAQCSCALATIGTTRLMVKVAMPGTHAMKNALLALSAVDALGGDLAMAATAMANIEPRSGYGSSGVLGPKGYHAQLLDYAVAGSYTALEGAMTHLGQLPDTSHGRRILVLDNVAGDSDGNFDPQKRLFDLLVRYDLDRVMALDRGVAGVAESAGIANEFFDSIDLLQLRLERVLHAKDILLVMGRPQKPQKPQKPQANLASLVKRLTSKQGMLDTYHMPLAAE